VSEEVVVGAVEATTQKYGGGVKINGVFYDLEQGIELPEKGRKIEAVVKGRKIIRWKYIDEVDTEDSRKIDDSEGSLRFGEIPKLPRYVQTAADIFLGILKYVDGKIEGMSTKDKVVVASVIFKEVMEFKRVAQRNGKDEGA